MKTFYTVKKKVNDGKDFKNEKSGNRRKLRSIHIEYNLMDTNSTKYKVLSIKSN